MELRNRATGGVRRDERPPLHDVALGPMVYGGERYGKMSERMKRQQKRMADINVESTANRLITPRLVGVAIGLIFMTCFMYYLQYQTSARRRRNKQG